MLCFNSKRLFQSNGSESITLKILGFSKLRSSNQQEIISYPLRRLRCLAIKEKFNIDARIDPQSPMLKINIQKSKSSKLNVNGVLYFSNFFYNNSQINIILKEDSSLKINGDLLIGGGTTIHVGAGASLDIGGKRDADLYSAALLGSVISVQKNISIGYDCMITKGVTIIDSNFHFIAYDGLPVNSQTDVLIGDHVWVCPDSTILKGSVIGSGCIVGNKSLVSGQAFPEHCFIAGIPAKVIREKCEWKRSLT
jgi:carbonic anhydrase/acetyltransferase-like protein (isoleucine patch superfamily)